MDLISMLPLLKGWSCISKKVDTSLNIPVAIERVIEDFKKPGWFFSLTYVFNDPDAKLIVYSVDPYGSSVDVVSITPRELYESGLIIPSSYGLWSSKYDDTERVYTVCYTPTTPLFFRAFRLVVAAPSNKSVTLLKYMHTLVLISEEDLLAESLRKVLGTEKLALLERLLEVVKPPEVKPPEEAVAPPPPRYPCRPY